MSLRSSVASGMTPRLFLKILEVSVTPISKIFVPKHQHFSSLYLNTCQPRYYHIAFVTASLPTQKMMSIFLCTIAKSFFPPPLHGDTSPTISASCGAAFFPPSAPREVCIPKQQETQPPGHQISSSTLTPPHHLLEQLSSAFRGITALKLTVSWAFLCSYVCLRAKSRRVP